MKLIDYHYCDKRIVFLQLTLCIFISTNDVTSGIDIGIGYQYCQKPKYWVLGAEIGIVLTLTVNKNKKNAYANDMIGSMNAEGQQRC